MAVKGLSCTCIIMYKCQTTRCRNNDQKLCMCQTTRLVCSCGYTAETSEHLLLHCPLYNSIRNKTINKLDENERNINTLLFGNDQLHLETNKKIFAIVDDFLRQTDRL